MHLVNDLDPATSRRKAVKLSREDEVYEEAACAEPQDSVEVSTL